MFSIRFRSNARATFQCHPSITVCWSSPILHCLPNHRLQLLPRQRSCT